ncbi:MAG: anion transporter [Nitrospiraceae bacterium]|nr:anion transporter [Nitrospiraceae bacterium]
MNPVVLAVAAVTYAGIAIGGIPGLALDRTAIALIGAICMIATGELSTHDAVMSIDVPTILLLYGLMVLSSQFRLGGFYTQVALRLTSLLQRPRTFLLAVMAASALLSAVLMNDIVCLAFTPVLTVSVLSAGLNPVPFLIGLAAASNIGSAATIIGNPQNMLIGQLGMLHFGRFLLWCGPPSTLALAAAYLVIGRIYRGDLAKTPSPAGRPDASWPAFDRHQSMKGIAATAVLIGLFFTSVPREISAICVAGVLLCSRSMHTRSILGLVDWHLLTLFCGLFIVVKGVETTGLPLVAVDFLARRGIDLRNLYLLTLVSGGLSNLVSNVPATMLLTKFLDPSQHPQWYALALSSTFAGNLITIGSIANLITFEQAKTFGVEIGFREHARAGIPVTVASFVIAAGWIALAG